jgi:hypothetical protein
MRQFALTAVLALAATYSFAQAEAQDLVGGPPECSREDVARARAGEYSGPPCRFTQDHAYQTEQAARRSQRSQIPVRPHPQPSIQTRQPTPPPAPPEGQTIRLSDDFFQGSLTGGVERPGTPLYGYRGLILIDAAGQVRYGRPGLAYRTGVVRAMDATPYQPPRASYPGRAYPYN